MWPVVPGVEYDLIPERVGVRMYGARRCSRNAVRMHADIAENPPEARLEKGSGFGIERLARRAQRLVHDRRRGRSIPFKGGGCALNARCRRQRLDICVRHPHDALGDAVGLLFVPIVWFADSKGG